MRPIRQSLALLALLAIFTTLPAQAETFHTCAVINTVPTVISTQGVYCLTHDISTAITSGSAIDIQANNVTIDCNGFKLGGLAAGTSSQANGIDAGPGRLNITVRNCGIRGFYFGINLEGGAGHLVEDNRFDNNLFIGISVAGDNNRVQRNRVYDTGGAPGSIQNRGIDAAADVIDNTVAGVFASTTDGFATGIFMTGTATEARGNQVRGLVATGSGTSTGIFALYDDYVTVRNNAIAATAAGTGAGVVGNGTTYCTGNTISNFSTPMLNCLDIGGNGSN